VDGGRCRDDLRVSGAGSLEALVEQLLARVTRLEAALVERDHVIAGQAERITELERRVSADSSNSSRRRRRIRGGTRTREETLVTGPLGA
jgi:hypothetical protein